LRLDFARLRLQLGTTEVWELYNFTEDAHPIHLHQVHYQVLDRQQIAFTDSNEPDGIPDDVNHDGQITIGPGGSDNDIFLLGEPISGTDLNPEDQGNQDTVWVGPGEVLRIIAEFDLAGEYVWHCHILSHEDHEMMRPFEVLDPLVV
jgi:spore coat protein A